MTDMVQCMPPCMHHMSVILCAACDIACVTDLAEQWASEVEDIQQRGVGEVSQTRNTGKSERLQLAVNEGRYGIPHDT